jgi:tRNA pseudouridine38-40 synthase
MKAYPPNAKKIRLALAYDGGAFGGWQKQKDGLPTVQGELEGQLSRFFNQPIKVVGAGRTDAGVHALEQSAHFVAPKAFREDRLVVALNKMTPASLSVLGAWEVPLSFHALGAAMGKIYRYHIWNHPVPHPFLGAYSTWMPRPLDLKKLQACAKFFVGKHDFSSFQTAGSEVLTTVREVHSAAWEKKGHRLSFTIQGEGFLKQMVRNIVGLQLDLLRQNRSPEEIASILEARDRRAAGSTASPEGLFLVKVLYPRELDNQCRKL